MSALARKACKAATLLRGCLKFLKRVTTLICCRRFPPSALWRRSCTLPTLVGVAGGSGKEAPQHSGCATG